MTTRPHQKDNYKTSNNDTLQPSISVKATRLIVVYFLPSVVKSTYAPLYYCKLSPSRYRNEYNQPPTAFKIT